MADKLTELTVALEGLSLADLRLVLRFVEGGEFKVPDSLIDYRPSKVSIGKRKRWREGGR